MENTIYLKDALIQMKTLDLQKNPVPFSLKVRQFNRQTQNGGKIKFYENVTLLQSGKTQIKSNSQKNPNHWENRTRNIKLPNGDIKKIHILFMIEFNGKKVVF